MKRPLVGGAPVTLAEDANPSGVSALAWLDDGSILYEAEDVSLDVVRWIARISEDGEPLGIVFGPEEQVAPAWARGLPGARGALVIGCPGTGSCVANNANLYVVDFDDLSWEIAVEQVMRAWYAPTGHIVYVRADGAVFAQPFDPADLELTGSVIPLFDGVRVPQLWADMLLGADGTLLYVEGEGGAVGGSITPVWVERDGTAREIDPAWRTQGTPNFSSLALSPNEDRFAISIPPFEGTYDLWVKQLDTGPLSRLTFEGTQNHRATWSPNGESLRFLSNRAGNLDLWTKRADGSGTAELVLDRDGSIWEALYSSDGTWLVFRVGAFQAGDIYAIRPGVDSVAVPLEVMEFQELSISLSPNDRWLAYVSNNTGRDEVYVRPFPPDAGSGLVQVSTDGGTGPVWAHSGRELFYRNGANELVAVQVTEGPTFVAGQQEVLFPMDGYLIASGHAMYDVSADDRRFVMLRIGDAGTAAAELILVTNFFEELRQRVPN